MRVASGQGCVATVTSAHSAFNTLGFQGYGFRSLQVHLRDQSRAPRQDVLASMPCLCPHLQLSGGPELTYRDMGLAQAPVRVSRLRLLVQLFSWAPEVLSGGLAKLRPGCPSSLVQSRQCPLDGTTLGPSWLCASHV
jgi:hypothetical protein